MKTDIEKLREQIEQKLKERCHEQPCGKQEMACEYCQSLTVMEILKGYHKHLGSGKVIRIE